MRDNKKITYLWKQQGLFTRSSGVPFAALPIVTEHSRIFTTATMPVSHADPKDPEVAQFRSINLPDHTDKLPYRIARYNSTMAS